MPIRNVVTRGFGNGTYSPGVSFVPPRGYGSAAPETDPGAGWIAANRPTLFTASPRSTLLTARPRSTFWTAPSLR